MKPVSSTGVFTGLCALVWLGLCVSGARADGNDSPAPNPPKPVARDFPVDVVLERLDEFANGNDFVGENIVNDDAHQTFRSLVAPGDNLTFRGHIKNTGAQAASFQVFLNAPVPANGIESPWKAAGWIVSANASGQTNDISVQLQDKKGWTTPLLAPGDEVVVNLSFSAPSPAVLPTKTPVDAGSFRLLARSEKQGDVVVGQLLPQFITKVEWSRDLQHWTEVTDKTVIEVGRFAVVNLRTERTLPDEDFWPASAPMGPVWTWKKTETHGDDTSLHASELTGVGGAPVSVSYGTSSLSWHIHVVDSDALFKPDPK